MKFIKVGQLVLIISSLLITQMVLPGKVEAGATLSFSPSSKSLKVGESWSAKVMVTATQQINSGTVKVTFDAAKLKATTIGCGADFSTPIAPSIANGSASISCARFSPFTGTGHFATVTFQAVAVGSTSLAFGVSTIVANDGQGTNVYTGGGTASVSITAESSAPLPSSQPSGGASQPAPTQAPVVQQPTGTATPTISSSTHADQEKWYKEKKIELSWTKTANEYNFALDQTANTQLPQQVRNGATTASETISGDGVWYAHVRAKSDKGWSNTAHYKLQIDSTAPTSPKISTEPASPMKVLPTISFSAEDTISGVEYYEIKLGDGEWQKTVSPYKPSQLTSGKHTIGVRAVDRAGNSAETQANFEIVPLAAPKLDDIGSSLLMLGESFTISGSAPAGTNVEIYVNGEKKETVVADNEGRFKSKEEYLLFPGTYEFTAKAINTDGISSPMSESQAVTIDARAVSVMGLVLPGWGVFGLGGVIMALLLIGLLWLAYRLWRQSQIWSNKLGVVGKHLDTNISQLEGDLTATVEASLVGVDPQKAAAIKESIAKQIDKVEEAVDEELKQAGSLELEVLARGKQPILNQMHHKIMPLLAESKDKIADLIGTIKSKTKKRAAVENSKQADQGEPSKTEVPEEAKKILSELEQKAEAGEATDEHKDIPEIGDILAPEK